MRVLSGVGVAVIYIGLVVSASPIVAEGLYEPACGECSGTECGGPTSSEGSVYLYSGEFHHEAIDMRIRGRGLDFIWARKYRSRLGPISRMGQGWDSSYNMRIVLADDAPGQVGDVTFAADGSLLWQPPIKTGGPIESLVYCTLRTTDPTDFSNNTTSKFIEIDSPDTTSVDSEDPPPGTLFSYVIAAKNISGQGPYGLDSDGVPREAQTCGAPAGPDVMLFDGHTRVDTYQLQVDGTWQAPEHFRVFSQEPDESYLLTFPDGGTWRFFPLDGSPTQGKISALVDRNGNTMSFGYDAGGLLTEITDTLGRQITIGYDENGFVGSVTDFAGRQVVYQYYDGIEPGGSWGDLKSVTSPPIVGSPTENDFPAGKTMVYTYSTGFVDARLNHNLLTITDAKGQTFLTNEYSSETDPSGTTFDHVVRQRLGETDEIIDYAYLPQTSRGPGLPVLQTIVNDRVGNVEEHFFDSRNRNVMSRELSGRAVADQPTTDTLNRPTGQLRPTDPAFFETSWEYNAESRVTRVIEPSLNERVFTYDSGNSSRKAQGNLLQVCQLPGPLGGDQTQICRQLEYVPGSNFISREVDGRGNETLHTYDPNGNRIHTTHAVSSVVEDFEYNAFGQVTAHILPDNGSNHRRRDEFTYYTTGPATGYRHLSIEDATGFALTSTFEYDILGNVVRSEDPNGDDALFIHNSQDQIARETSSEINGVRYQRDFYYDANNNLVRVDVQNIDDQGILQPNTHFTTVKEYDILNFEVRRCEESGSYSGTIPGTIDQPTCAGLPDSEFVTTEFEYDSNRNRTLERFGEAAEGRQPNNTLNWRFDERDLVWEETRGKLSPDQSTVQYDYDPNGNRVRISSGIEDPSPHVTVLTFDGFDRMVSRTDAMGNVTTFEYDADDNKTRTTTFGQLFDAPGSVGNVRLQEVEQEYDGMNRRTREIVEFFDTLTQTPLLGGQQVGKSISDTAYSGNSQIVSTTNDNQHATITTYDGANRRQTVIDPKGNSRTFSYDSNSNLIGIVQVDQSDLGAPAETFTTTYAYDALDRRITEIDSSGNSTSFGYDSRGNRTRTIDPLLNVETRQFDGINRLVSTTRELTDTGTGSGSSIGTIVTLQLWDDSSRLVSQVDDSGNATGRDYDGLNRLIAVTAADGTVRTFGYDPHGNRVLIVDANGTSAVHTYDGLNRLIARSIVPAPGVSSDTTFESYTYDGLSRLVAAEDDDSNLAFAHDSMSNRTTESINGVSTVVDYDGLGNPISMTYPGGRVVASSFDELERKQSVTSSTGNPSVVTYHFVGAGRVTRREMGNGTRSDYTYDGISGVPNPLGDFGVGRTIELLHSRVSDNMIIEDRSFRWDRAQNRSRRSDLRAGGPQLSHDYQYDSDYRLAQTLVIDATLTILRDTGYVLDDLGNRVQVTGGPDAGLYTMDPGDPPAVLAVNQYTDTPMDSRAYDANGNLISLTDGLNAREVAYDYRDRLVQYTDPLGVVTSYGYDALGRRISKITGSDDAQVVTEYFYSGDRVVEERDGAGDTLATFVYGSVLDDVVNMQRGVDFYPHADDQGNIIALTDAGGNVVERYEYFDFGAPMFFDVDGDPLPGSGAGNPYLFTGRRFDPESGLYYYRTRHLDPDSGRFLQRDAIGVWGDPENRGNAYTYAGNNPATFVDPLGTVSCTPGACGIGKTCSMWADNCTTINQKKSRTTSTTVTVTVQGEGVSASAAETESETVDTVVPPGKGVRVCYTYDCKCEYDYWDTFWECFPAPLVNKQYSWNCTLKDGPLWEERKAPCGGGAGGGNGGGGAGGGGDR